MSGRWFCRYLCPLGAAYGLFNYISPLQVVHNEAACNGCGRCEGLCPMDVKNERGSFLDVTGCIKCGRCVKACRTGARNFSVSLRLATKPVSADTAQAITKTETCRHKRTGKKRMK